MTIYKYLYNSLLFASLLLALGCRQDSSTPSPSPTATNPANPTLQANAGGGATDVGSGGNGSEAEWKSIAAELAENLRLLNRAPIDNSIFLKIKKDFPELIKKTTVTFKNYPLIHGVETATVDNPSALPAYKSDSCKDLKTTTSVQEKDAINFASQNLIKVNGPKFSCYRKNKSEVRRLIFHEYLGLMGISESTDGKTGYETTNAMLKAFAALPKFDESRDVGLIHNCQELQDIGIKNVFEVANGAVTPVKIWRLAHDIDCADSDTFNDGAGFRPLIVWGHIDGDGYAIKNLKITNRVPLEKQLVFTEQKNGVPDDEGHFKLNKSKALFYVNCTRCNITNLSLVNADVEGGGLLVTHNLGSVQNVSVQGKLHGPIETMGGLASENKGSISQARVDVEIDQEPLPPHDGLSQSAGGMIGDSDDGSVIDGTIIAKIKGNQFVGGFAASLWNSFASNINMNVELTANDYYSLAGLVAMMEQTTIRNVRAKVSIHPKAYSLFHERMYLAGAIGQAVSYEELKGDVRAQGSEISSIHMDAKICGVEAETLNSQIIPLNGHNLNELRVSKDFGGLLEVNLGDNLIHTSFEKTCPSN